MAPDDEDDGDLYDDEFDFVDDEDDDLSDLDDDEDRDEDDSAVDDEGEHEAAHVGHAAGIVLDEGVGDAMREAQAPAVLVQPQEMIAEPVGFGGPQLAYGPFGKGHVAHDQTLRVVCSPPPRLRSTGCSIASHKFTRQ